MVETLQNRQVAANHRNRDFLVVVFLVAAFSCSTLILFPTQIQNHQQIDPGMIDLWEHQMLIDGLPIDSFPKHERARSAKIKLKEILDGGQLEDSR